MALWALNRWIARSKINDWALMLTVVACVAAAPVAVYMGLPLAWGLLLLSLGPVVAIVYHECGRTHRSEEFAMR